MGIKYGGGMREEIRELNTEVKCGPCRRTAARIPADPFRKNRRAAARIYRPLSGGTGAVHPERRCRKPEHGAHQHKHRMRAPGPYTRKHQYGRNDRQGKATIRQYFQHGGHRCIISYMAANNCTVRRRGRSGGIVTDAWQGAPGPVVAGSR